MGELEVNQEGSNENKEIFTEDLLSLIKILHFKFEPQRQELLSLRKQRQKAFDRGELPNFGEHYAAKNAAWSVKPIPHDLLDRRVEITGPISNSKMVINMLSENSEGEIACTAMLDFEDSMAPTWSNVLSGYQNIIGVAKKNLTYTQKESNGTVKTYALNPKAMAHPMVRVRGLHMSEENIKVGSHAVSAGLLDIAVCAYHTAKLFIQDNKTPKFYVPKCEHYLEARWWNEVFHEIETKLNLQSGQLRVTFLIETLPAAFQMEEILYEIRERACGLNGGRWDKIFSDIKTLKMHSKYIMADRSTIDMKKPWMDNYAKLLIKICHKHGAFAMGGMSAFTPGSDEQTRRLQLEKVQADKRREFEIGHDGCWVSHPYFIGMAKRQFEKINQLERTLEDFPSQPNLLPVSAGPKTLTGLRQNIRVGIAYQQGWDQGLGCIAFENLMEDLATLEISRAQVWQWLHHKVVLDDGTIVSRKLIETVFDEECLVVLKNKGLDENTEQATSFVNAKNKIKKIFLNEELQDFFTTMN